MIDKVVPINLIEDQSC